MNTIVDLWIRYQMVYLFRRFIDYIASYADFTKCILLFDTEGVGDKSSYTTNDEKQPIIPVKYALDPHPKMGRQ